MKNTLGIVSGDIGTLCISSLINKWSKNKPVRGVFPASANNKYGLDIANIWAYLKPRGLSNNEEYRLDDFQGYEHDQSKTLPRHMSDMTEQHSQEGQHTALLGTILFPEL